MRLIGMMPVRNEDWCLGLSLRVALQWCDAVIVFDHASTDRTADIVHDVMHEAGSGSVLYTFEKDPTWEEMEHRQWMLQAARKIGATHLAIIDADEILTGNLMSNPLDENGVRSHIKTRLIEGNILELPGYNLRFGIKRYHANGIWGKRWFSTAFADDPALSWTGNILHHREPFGKKLTPYRPIQQGEGGVMHLWGASERRLIAKHRAYRITEALKDPYKPHAEIERMYSWATDGEAGNAAYGTPATWDYTPVPVQWWAPYAHWMHHLDLDSEPWQEGWADEMISIHGRERFAGLRV